MWGRSSWKRSVRVVGRLERGRVRPRGWGEEEGENQRASDTSRPCHQQQQQQTPASQGASCPVPAACYLWWPRAAGNGRCRRALPGSSRLLQRFPGLNRKQIALDESYAGMFLSRAGPELWKTRCHSAEPWGNPLYSPLPLLLARVAAGSCRYLVQDVHGRG